MHCIFPRAFAATLVSPNCLGPSPKMKAPFFGLPTMPTMHPDAAAPRERRKPGPKPGERKAQPLEIFPELPTPTGQEVRELRQAMGWTLEQAAGLVGLYDASAMGSVERDATALSPQRWTLMLLAAQRHPTLKLVPADSAPSSEPPLS